MSAKSRKRMMTGRTEGRPGQEPAGPGFSRRSGCAPADDRLGGLAQRAARIADAKLAASLLNSGTGSAPAPGPAGIPGEAE